MYLQKTATVNPNPDRIEGLDSAGPPQNPNPREDSRTIQCPKLPHINTERGFRSTLLSCLRNDT